MLSLIISVILGDRGFNSSFPAKHCPVLSFLFSLLFAITLCAAFAGGVRFPTPLPQIWHPLWSVSEALYKQLLMVEIASFLFRKHD